MAQRRITDIYHILDIMNALECRGALVRVPGEKSPSRMATISPKVVQNVSRFANIDEARVALAVPTMCTLQLGKNRLAHVALELGPTRPSQLDACLLCLRRTTANVRRQVCPPLAAGERGH